MSNPLICNCDIKWLKYWINNTKIATGNIKCTYPHNLTYHSLSTLNDLDLVCTQFNSDYQISHEQCGISTFPSEFNENNLWTIDCPKNCSCLNNTVRCSHSNLRIFPLDIPKNTREL